MGKIIPFQNKQQSLETLTNTLHNFILNYTVGKQKVIEFKNNLFEIKDKYRNPAAHPSNYSRQLFDSFKSLLFTQGFMKKYLEAIQIETVRHFP